MMLLIDSDFYFYTFLLQSLFEDHQLANFQPLSTESSYAIKLNITRLLCEEYVCCVESEKSKCDFHIFRVRKTKRRSTFIFKSAILQVRELISDDDLKFG